jgi:hypothetical protein
MIRITKANCKEFQGILGYVYEDRKILAEVHPEVFAKFAKRIQKHPHFTSEEEAYQAARDLSAKTGSAMVLAKIGKDEEFYYIDDYFIVTDDGLVKQAADYIGMVDVATF